MLKSSTLCNKVLSYLSGIIYCNSLIYQKLHQKFQNFVINWRELTWVFSAADSSSQWRWDVIGFAGTASALVAGWCWGQSIPWPATSAPTPSLHSHCTMQHAHDKQTHTHTHEHTHTHTHTHITFQQNFHCPSPDLLLDCSKMHYIQFLCWEHLTLSKIKAWSWSAAACWLKTLHVQVKTCRKTATHTQSSPNSQCVELEPWGCVKIRTVQQMSNQKFWSHIFSPTNFFTPSDIPCLQQSTKANHPQHPAVGTSDA